MNTNAIPYWDTAIKINEHLAGAPAGLLVFMFCIASGYAWRIIHVLPNRVIPAVVMVTGIISNPLLYWPSTFKDGVRLGFVGAIIGFIAWIVHKLLFKTIEDKLGVNLDENTEFITKPKTNNEDTTKTP